MRVIVLGAGVVGVTSAWYLSEAGHQVTVIDRQPIAGYETSFANGGQISVSHAEPWANPDAPAKILSWLGREDAPLLYRPRFDLRQWKWGASFLRECLPGRTRRNTLTILALALYSAEQLRRLRARTGIRYDQVTRGILQLYTDAEAFVHANERVQLMRQHGFDMQVVTADQCVNIEPSLQHTRVTLIGGTYAPSDESGDAHMFSRRLEELCRGRGVEFRFNTTILRLLAEGGKVTGVRIRSSEGVEDTLRADAYVASLGSFTPFLVEPLGVDVPVFPVKGYSATLPANTQGGAPQVCLSDDSGKLAVSRLGERLRIAGTAELNSYDNSLNLVRCMAIVSRMEELFPYGGDYSRAQFWSGLRPATPSNVPLIGRTRLPNLFLNTGHGTLGWTLACGSGQALADIVDQRKPEVDFAFLGAQS